MILTKVLRDVREPVPFVYKTSVPCANPSLLIGLELETENCRAIGREVSTASIEACGFRIETDNSLRGSAFEFISQPMASQHALAALADFFKATKFDETNYSDRCSTHVHVNCTNLTLEQISSIALIYQVVEEILFEFIGHNRDSNIYCIPWNQCRNHHRLVANFLSNPTQTVKGWQKYTALNLLPLLSYGTIEFRQMNGTSDMERLTTWINVIGSIFNYATKIELKDLTNQIKELNTTSHYENFFNGVLGGYLPYNELYRARLSEGVILAKFGLVSDKAPVVEGQLLPDTTPQQLWVNPFERENIYADIAVATQPGRVVQRRNTPPPQRANRPVMWEADIPAPRTPLTQAELARALTRLNALEQTFERTTTEGEF